MGIRDTIKSWFTNFLGISEQDTAIKARVEKLAELKEYYDGLHKQQLRVKPGKFNDNLSINLCGLIVDKSVSALVGDPADGHGLHWEFPSQTSIDPVTKEKKRLSSPAIEWLDEVWDINNKETLLHKNAMSGAYSGFPAIKIVTDGIGGIRLVNMNPILLTVDTDPQDMESVIMYTIRYAVYENDKQVYYKEETTPRGDNWIIETKRQKSGDKWELMDSTVWPYDFPNILAWQNLPDDSSVYGRSDIESIVPIQDRYNFLVSNISKIVRLYAHPQRYGRNISAQMQINPQSGQPEIAMGPDEMPLLNGDGEIIQMPPVGDLPGAMDFLHALRESAFMLSREVDTLSLKDKVGDITNFALRVLYRDFLDKLGTKRMMYGNAYQELNRRLLILGGYPEEICEIYWPDPLPINEVEEITAIKGDMELGLVSKQTAREIRNYDHERESERLAAEKGGEDNAGAVLLQNFFAGRNQ